MRAGLPTTGRIALLAIVLSLAGNVALIAFVRYTMVDEHVAFLDTLERSLLLAFLLSLLFGVVSGVLIARYVGRRVDDLARVADAVGAGDLSRRAPVSAGNDPFDHLSQRINSMLDRIEGLMGELRLLTESLAHDLRSPIGRLRSRAEQALGLTDDTQRDQLLADVLDEADNLTRMLTIVLEISRSESMAARGQFASIDVADLVIEVGEMFEPLAEENGRPLLVSTAAPGMIDGHRQLLAQALSNLIENAIKYGSGPIELFSRNQGRRVAIGVRDHGAGIAPADQAEARRRFGRLDAARQSPGAGLGLALVESIAHLHGGILELGDAAPGLEARVVI